MNILILFLKSLCNKLTDAEREFIAALVAFADEQKEAVQS